MLLIDEREGSRVAVQKGLRVTGTLGLLDLAAERALIDFGGAVQAPEWTTFRRPAALLRELPAKHEGADSLNSGARLLRTVAAESDKHARRALLVSLEGIS